MSVAVIGGGAFGTALALSLARSGHSVRIWARDQATITAINTTRQLPRLAGVVLPNAIQADADIDVVARADTVLLAVPMQALAGVLHQIDGPLKGQRLVACCKGIDLETLHGATATIASAKPAAVPAILSGPSFAVDIAANLPTALTLACKMASQGALLQEQLSGFPIRIYRSTDTIGVELGGALKNVIAIACGACIGQGLGESARAALMTRGFAEMTRLATRLGAAPKTLAGLSGFGDLALTCMSEKSRNYRFGLSLGLGLPCETDITIEGVKTAEAVTRLAADLGLDMPICKTVHDISGGVYSVAEAIQYLLNRPLKEE